MMRDLTLTYLGCLQIRLSALSQKVKLWSPIKKMLSNCQTHRSFYPTSPEKFDWRVRYQCYCVYFKFINLKIGVLGFWG